MTLVDGLKYAKSKLDGLLLPAPVVYHHVPKCGGTSVGRALRQRYILSQQTVAPEESFRAFEAFTGQTDRDRMLVDVLDLREQMMLYHLFNGVACFSGHVRFSNVAFALFADRYRFVTILREPVSRFISHYFWSFGKPHAHARIEEDFAPFLETDRARRLGATYAEYFCGLPKDTDFTSDVAIVAAIDNLKFMDVVGRLDDVDDFERRLRDVVGARIRIGHQNKMRQAPTLKSSVVLPELREKVETLCAPDLAIWRALFS